MRNLPDSAVSFDLKGPAGRLEAVLEPPGVPLSGSQSRPTTTAMAGIAVILHPHPLYGGDMKNQVVQTVAQHFRNRGATTLRFNFRGTGRSAGSHDEGRGEVGDLEAALAWAEGTFTEGPLWLAGYSFGAAVLMQWLAGSQVNQPDRGPAAALMLAPPIEHYDWSVLAANPVPLALVCGTADGLTPRDQLETQADTWGGFRAAHWVEDAEHDLDAGGTAFAEAVEGALDDLSSG